VQSLLDLLLTLQKELLSVQMDLLVLLDQSAHLCHLHQLALLILLDL
jgi:hypothetical protein